MSLHRSNCAANAGSERRPRAHASEPAAPVPGSTPYRCRRSFDYLIGAQEERRRDGEAESLSGLEVDDELELCGLLDWEAARLHALQDLVHVDGRVPVHSGIVRTVRHEASGVDVSL